MSFNTNIQYDDFTGFTFAGTHSSELNVVRTSDGGKRYEENLTPTFQDKTVQVGGRDSTYLFGSYYQKKEFNLSIAFDNVSEEDFRKIQNWGADKKIHQLIFDEKPYKYYNAKLAAPIQLKYICFDESEMLFAEPAHGSPNRRTRIYKGEGTMKLVCYEGIARGTVKSLEELGSEIPPKYCKVYIDKDRKTPYEISLDCFDNISEVQLYLSRDFLYDRDQWGAPNRDEYGRLMPGQKDPYTKQASTSYYAYQPQKVLVELNGDMHTNISLESDYQTYLFPIDLKTGFIGQIDTATLETNGTLIDNGEMSYEDQRERREVEIVQYDPSLKVTYGLSSKSGNYIQEYGCYTFELNDEGNWVPKKLKYIDKEYAIWEDDAMEINSRTTKRLVVKDKYLGNEVFFVGDYCEYTNKSGVFKDFIDLLRFEEKYRDKFSAADYQKIFVVQNDTNSFLPATHSIYLLPNSDCRTYFLECRYEDKNHKPQTVKMEIIVDDVSNFPKDRTENNSNKEFYLVYGGIQINNTTQGIYVPNYIEWASSVNLPEKTPSWGDRPFSENAYYEFQNCGDLEMPFKCIFEAPGMIEEELEVSAMTLRLNDKFLKIDSFILEKEDQGFIIDTELRIIRGFYREKGTTSGKIIYTGNIYDRYIIAGDYFYIPIGTSKLYFDEQINPPIIDYEYRYY